MKRFGLYFLGFVAVAAQCEPSHARAVIQIPSGVYEPFFREPGEADQRIVSFWMDKDPVSRKDFARFLQRNPEFGRGKISPRFADSAYLESWTSENVASGDSDSPVTSISWFVARKYCGEKKGRLPTVSEWEYAADTNSPEAFALISDWYARPNSMDQPPPRISSGKLGKFGIRGMHGINWEWVEDFASVIIQGDSRSSNATDNQLFCAAGALSAKDPTQYANFMRFAFRSSLKANRSVRTLGFRCVYDVDPERSGPKL